MAIDKIHLQSLGGFDPVFTAAGDDVDISWRLLKRRRDARLRARRGRGPRPARLGARLRGRSRWLWHGEALLARKYPERVGARIYGYNGWQVRWFGLPRIYHGAIGRGLFQTVYPAGIEQPLIDLPLSARWIGMALLLHLDRTRRLGPRLRLARPGCL